MAKAARASGIDVKTIMDAGGWKTMSVFHRYSIGDRKDQQRYADAMARARTQAAEQKPEAIDGRLVGGDAKTYLGTATKPEVKVR